MGDDGNLRDESLLSLVALEKMASVGNCHRNGHEVYYGDGSHQQFQSQERAALVCAALIMLRPLCEEVLRLRAERDAAVAEAVERCAKYADKYYPDSEIGNAIRCVIGGQKDFLVDPESGRATPYPASKEVEDLRKAVHDAYWALDKFSQSGNEDALAGAVNILEESLCKHPSVGQTIRPS